VASTQHLPEYYITIPVSNIVTSLNDVTINQIFIAFRRERRDVQLIGGKQSYVESRLRSIQSEVHIKPLSFGFVKIVTRQILMTNLFDYNRLLKM